MADISKIASEQLREYKVLGIGVGALLLGTLCVFMIVTSIKQGEYYKLSVMKLNDEGYVDDNTAVKAVNDLESEGVPI